MPKHEHVHFTREQLYDLVWSTPMTTIATDFGMSSVAFAKHCKKMEVPIPPRGHWQRVRTGYRAKRLALPRPSPRTPREIEIPRYDAKPATPSMPTPVVVVSQRLTKPHPALLQMRDRLRRTDGTEGTSIRGSGHAVLRVAEANKGRAFRILDALFKAFDSVGDDVQLSSAERGHHRHALHVLVPDRPRVEIWLTEHLKRSKHTVTELEKKWGLEFARKYDLAYSGRLLIEIDAPYTSDGSRRCWADSPHTPLEQKLGDVVVGVHAAADALKARGDELERQRLAREQDRQVEAESLRRQERERDLERDLREMAKRWQEAETMRAFLDAVGRNVPPDDRSTTFCAWFAWAQGYVRRHDPLGSPSGIPKVTGV